MAYTYQMPNCCPMCSSFHCGGHNQFSTPTPAQYCCYSQQCCCCQHHACPDQHPERTTRPNNGRNNARNKLARSQSTCCVGKDAAKGASSPRHERKRARVHHHSPHKCCSSSRAAVHHGAQERGRGQPQSRHLPAPSCDINRLMSMVRDPRRYCSTAYDTAYDSSSSQENTSDTSTTEDAPLSSLPQLPMPTEFTDSELPEDTEDPQSLAVSQDGYDGDCDNCKSVELERFKNMQTRVKFMPPASCIMLVKRADQQRLVKTDRQVQCCFDISSDFCSCAKEVCEFCAKKIVCICPRIRCCMCAKLKSTADRKAHVVSVCRCPKMYRCCGMATSFLRFNSSPALTQGRTTRFECASSGGPGRPFTF